MTTLINAKDDFTRFMLISLNYDRLARSAAADF